MSMKISEGGMEEEAKAAFKVLKRKAFFKAPPHRSFTGRRPEGIDHQRNPTNPQ